MSVLSYDGLNAARLGHKVNCLFLECDCIAQHIEENSMMRLTLVLPAIFFVSTAFAAALESRMTVSSSLSQDALWKAVGDFCGIPFWHPWIQKCTLSADGKQRTITFVTGATAVEALEDW